VRSHFYERKINEIEDHLCFVYFENKTECRRDGASP
jgi:hypothetical protein